LLASCWQAANKLLTGCPQAAGKLLTSCWQAAGKLPAGSWQAANKPLTTVALNKTPAASAERDRQKPTTNPNDKFMSEV
jgi:hypothetical protein